MGYAYQETGFVTGSDRFEERAFREENRDWNELTSFGHNVAPPRPRPPSSTSSPHASMPATAW